MPIIYIGLGSNLGDRQLYLEQATAMLAPGVIVLRRSPIYETQPWGYANQGTFLNQVLEAETVLSPRLLLTLLKAIEARLGRRTPTRNGPREIDLDILLYDDQALNERNLIIPHPGLHERAFILAPLADLAPDMLIRDSQTVSQLLSNLDCSGVVRYQP